MAHILGSGLYSQETNLDLSWANLALFQWVTATWESLSLIQADIRS